MNVDNDIESWIISSEHESCSIDINWEIWIELTWMILFKWDLYSIHVKYDLWAWLDDELNEYIYMRIILEYDWVINMWEKYEYMRIILSYDDILIIWRIIESLFYKDNRKDSIILNFQSIWELIYLNQNIFKMMKWLSINMTRNIFLWEMLII